MRNHVLHLFMVVILMLSLSSCYIPQKSSATQKDEVTQAPAETSSKTVTFPWLTLTACVVPALGLILGAVLTLSRKAGVKFTLPMGWNGTSETPRKRKRSSTSARAYLQEKRQLIEASLPDMADLTALGYGPPLLHRRSIYVDGDNHYDDSFELEAAKRFVGECGISTASSERLLGELPAFEVWLFDTDDIVTVRGLFRSFHRSQAFPEDKARPNSPGDFQAQALAVPDHELWLETRHLRLRARVVSMACGDNPAGCLEHGVFEIAVWPSQP